MTQRLQIALKALNEIHALPGDECFVYRHIALEALAAIEIGAAQQSQALQVVARLLQVHEDRTPEDALHLATAMLEVQPSQAGELSDTKRLDWIRDQLFEHRWNGVIGKGCVVQWQIAPDFRFKQRELIDDSGIAAGDFRRAIDAAINTK